MSEDSARAVSAGHTAERIGYFTDAVFAIAMTLLVIEIPRPDSKYFSTSGGVSKSEAVSRLWHFLLAQRPSFYAYLLAFYILWIVWREHHALLDQVEQVSGPIIGLHFPLLLLAAFLPYATTIMGHYADNPLADLLFGLVVGVIFICRSAIQARADRDAVLRPHVDRRAFHNEVVVSWTVTGYWLLTLTLVWLAPWVQFSWALAGGVAYVTDRYLTRRTARGQRRPE
jgi:uncharacterized membrane protein